MADPPPQAGRGKNGVTYYFKMGYGLTRSEAAWRSLGGSPAPGRGPPFLAASQELAGSPSGLERTLGASLGREHDA